MNAKGGSLAENYFIKRYLSKIAAYDLALTRETICREDYCQAIVKQNESRMLVILKPEGLLQKKLEEKSG
jgi:hypothetical protein